jgi:uncharacterized protein YfcZ (UPF0381/DUF406 family)
MSYNAEQTKSTCCCFDVNRIVDSLKLAIAIHIFDSTNVIR